MISFEIVLCPQLIKLRSHAMPHIFDQDLPRNEANFTPLSPLSFRR